MADYDRLPDEPRYELVFGRFHLTPSPFPRHQVVAQMLWLHFYRIAAAAGGFVFLAPLDVVLADHSVVQPDLLYMSAVRLELVGNRIEGAPDLVVEVLSLGTARYDRGRKLQLYSLYGIEEYWLVDHERRQIEFLTRQAGSFVAAPPAGVKYQSARIPEIHIDLSEFWRQVDTELLRVPRAR
ncbi:MAG TPA: Uma2 family endonuclease [Thermoanaerobaculia bacterium]|nr:Uma2 family endonuclease [Thermoanaerobaculia bacterium]